MSKAKVFVECGPSTRHRNDLIYSSLKLWISYTVVFPFYRWEDQGSARLSYLIVAVVQSLSYVQLFATPWTATRQSSLSFTISLSLLKLMSIESVMPYSHLILCHPLSSCPQSLPASESFPMSHLFVWCGQSIGVSASASVLPMNTQDWSPLGWTGWISLQSKGLSRVFNTTV